MALLYNGTTSISTGTITALGDDNWTLGCWAYPASAGELSLGTMIEIESGTTTRQQLFFNSSSRDIRCTQSYTTTSANTISTNTLATSTWACVIATHTASDNTIRIYLGDIATAMAQASYATQTAGTGTYNATGTNAKIGNRNATDLTWDGRIAQAFALPFLLTTDEMERFRLGDWSTLWDVAGVPPTFFLPLDTTTSFDLAHQITFTNTSTTIAEDPPVPASLGNTIYRVWRKPAGVARTLAALAPTASSAKAASSAMRAAGLAAKAPASSSSKATSVKEAKHFSAKSAAAANIPSMTIKVGGTAAFTTKVSTASGSRFRRVAAPTVSGLTRAYQGAAPTSSGVTTTIRRAVRRTGKWSTSDSAKARISYKKVLAAKNPAASKAKAVLSTTTAGGNPPAIPATIASAVAASKMIGMGNVGVTGNDIGSSETLLNKWHNKGWGGFAEGGIGVPRVAADSGYFTGSFNFTASNPFNAPFLTDVTYKWQRYWEGGNFYSSSGNPDNQFFYRDSLAFGMEPYSLVLWRPQTTFVVLYKPALGDYWNDTVQGQLGDWSAGLAGAINRVGGKGIWWDLENDYYGPRDVLANGTTLITHANRPSPTVAGQLIIESDTTNVYRAGLVSGVMSWILVGDITAANTKIESRGYEHGTKMFTAFPNMNLIVYSWRLPGSITDPVHSHPVGDYHAPTSLDYYMWGIFRAMKDLNSPGIVQVSDSLFYHGQEVSGTGGMSHDNANKYGLQGQLALLSQNLPATTRDYVMAHYGSSPFDWAGTDGTIFYDSTQQTEPAYTNGLKDHRRWGMFGRRFEFVFGMMNTGMPAGVTASWGSPDGIVATGNTSPAGAGHPLWQGQNIYDFPTGRPAGIVAAASTVSQDTMTVTGAVGIYQVSATSHSASPQATVECELTATVTNNSNSAITAPGVGFYDTNGVEVGYGASGGGSLAAGASQSFSTITSTVHSAYVPAAAGTVTIRARPGANGVDATSGFLDQTFTVAAAPPPPPAGSRLWADTSPWNTAKSQTGITFAAGADSALSTAPVNLNFDFSFNHPTYFASVSDHLVTINLGHSQIDGHTGGTLSKNAPAGMQPATGGDNVMFIQFTDGTYIDGYAVTKNSDTNFTFGEYVYSVDANHGTAITGTGFGDPSDGHRAGTTGIGSAQAGGTLLKRDVQNGSIPHGIFIAGTWDSILGDGLAGTPQVLPAINNDVAGHHGPVPEGGLMLIPTVTAMPGGLTAMEQQLFTALKTYGAYCCDTTAAGNFYVVYSDGSAECNAAFTGAGVQTVCHLLRLVKTW